MLGLIYVYGHIVDLLWVSPSLLYKVYTVYISKQNGNDRILTTPNHPLITCMCRVSFIPLDYSSPRIFYYHPSPVSSLICQLSSMSSMQIRCLFWQTECIYTSNIMRLLLILQCNEIEDLSKHVLPRLSVVICR